MRLEFGNLPLIEAAVRATLGTSIRLSFGLVYDLREALRPQFSVVSEPTKTEAAPGLTSPTVEVRQGMFISGAVFTDDASGIQIVVQERLVVARWTRPLATEAPEYPRFAALREALWKAIDALRDMHRDVPLPIAVANMSYANFIEAAEPAQVVEKYLSDSAQIGFLRNVRAVRKTEVGWQEPDGVDLRFDLEKVTANVRDEKKEGYRLTTAAGVWITDEVAARDAVENVHDRLQEFFVRLISEHAKQEWALEIANA